jgi:hypothetical protein
MMSKILKLGTLCFIFICAGFYLLILIKEIKSLNCGEYSDTGRMVDKMIKIQVRYHLSQKGLDFFPDWYEKVFKATSMQDGFVKMNYHIEGFVAVVNLDFKNQLTLDQWTETELHDHLAQQIEPYLLQPSDVSITEE